MIRLEQLRDGSMSARNFEALMSLVIDTGGVSFALRFGADTMSWAGSTDAGPVTISHGLGVVPVLALAFNADSIGGFPAVASYTCPTGVYTDTTFDAYGRTPSALTGDKAIFWIAIG